MAEDFVKVADLIVERITGLQKAVLTVDECVKYTGISKSALYKLMMRKQIPYSKPNGKLAYFDRVELEKWLMSNRVATENELNEQARAYCLREGGK